MPAVPSTLLGGGGITVGANVTGGVTAVGVVGVAAVVGTPCEEQRAGHRQRV